MTNSRIALELRYPDSPSCTCKLCKAQCHRPGWMTVDEAKAAIASGKGDQLMLDYLHLGGDKAIPVLCPANPGLETQITPWNGGPGGCVFQDEAGLCSIHASGFKPLECRAASHDPNKRRPGNIKEDIAREWATTEGVLLVNLWWLEHHAPAKRRGRPPKVRK